MLLKGLFVKFTIRFVGEVSPELEVGALSSLDVRSDILVNFSDRICDEKLEKYRLFPCLCTNSEIDDVSGFHFSFFDMSFRTNWLVAIEFAYVNLLCLLESLLELLSDWDKLPIFDLVLRKLV